MQVWVDEAEPRREAVIDYTLGGNPGHQRSGGGHQRSGGGHSARGAPVMSADGQVILFAPDVDVADRVVLHAAGHLERCIQPPPWATLVGQAYRLSATADAPSLAGTSLSFSYLGSEVPPGEEEWLKLYFRNNPEWLPARGTSTVRWDLRSGVGSGGWGAVPTETIFPTVTGSKARFWLDNCNIEHGYIYEFEVFNDNQPSSPVDIALGANPLETRSRLGRRFLSVGHCGRPHVLYRYLGPWSSLHRRHRPVDGPTRRISTGNSRLGNAQRV